MTRQDRVDARTLANAQGHADDGLDEVLQAFERHALTCEATYGITSDERRLLLWLDSSSTSDQLQAATGMSETAVAATLARLRKARFVDLAWDGDPDDTCSRVTPTPQGLRAALGMRATLVEAGFDRLDLTSGARHTDQATAELLAVASHELRTPLTTIAGFVSTLLDLDDDIDAVQRREFLELIDSQTARLRRLVQDLHLYSRVESGRIPVRVEEIDIRVAVEESVRDTQGHDIRVCCPPGLVARSDVDHLQQILGNYVANAIRYGAEPITIEVERAGASIVIAVCDRGPGIPESFAPRLFERFERGANRDIAGSGLGLSIVRGLARAQGGDAWYEPNEPCGARFCVRLPQAV